MTDQTGSGKTEPTASNALLKGMVLGLIGVMIFGGTLPGTRIAVETFGAGFLTFGRAFFAALAAVMILFLLKRRFPREHFASLLFIGLTLVFGFPGFVTLAMTTVPASHGGVVLAILPLGTAVFASIFAGERPSVLFWLCGITGALLVIIFSLRDGGWNFETGDIWLLAAAITASCGYVISGKLSAQMPGWEVICWALLFMGPVSLIGVYHFWEPVYLSAPSKQVWAFAYVSFGSMLIGFFFWNAGLQIGGISRVGQLQLLQPFFTLAISAVLLGETITLEMIGFAIAVVGVVVLGRKAKVAR